ncbi:acetyltransferase, ribosomal protein N-acetylase [Schinkia azotoformans MEV2011]|uniref:Acetyltransferase, ribosomal protein N-acetylase n=1 Tax=Schinkia azotoformans MEV2011 TaxID=1348973 RepID=A0A072NM06_SCHAZ|nr:GNAT family protein [Schinkia azotoformans]KEF38684.1 acetyltransferase, ribosomal protein N-acetylase [Schinkia azotoformans MEV2011]MEC1696890.1 GNAT family protein [Schinkia azotoformans]MEC1717861.1 GNAT family protein [Schinkia azotoformans]MEC1727229.1 GNAT family protein [Schinkia azotoformans]MEC1739710.1 GNAT family protein [Schinkia azotoformans]
MINEFYKKQIILENQLVKLIPFEEKYKEQLKDIIYDEEVYYSVECRNDEELQKYIDDTINQRMMGNAYPFLVIDKRTNEVAGSTRYGYIQFHNKRLEIGWTWYGKSYRGTGLNKACKFELLKFAFEVMEFRRVQFSADVRNIHSQKAIQKLGATKEGIFRANYIDTYGISRDDVYFSIVHTDWNEIKNRVFKEFI